MKRKKVVQARGSTQLPDRYLYLLLFAVSVLVRIPFLKNFDLVTYDGTYYINHAKTLLGMLNNPSGFPVGYPIFIALFIPPVHDGVRAAQTVSFLSGIGSLIVFFSLAKRFVSRNLAIAGALIFALTPLFVALSMMTLSESIYIFWVLLGLMCFAKDRDTLAGLFLGMATITRPEALGILGVLALLRLRRPKRLAWIAAGFAAAYCVNIVIQSSTAGKLAFEPKLFFSRRFGAGAISWKLRETWLDLPGREQALAEVREHGQDGTILSDFMKKMVQNLWLLVRHLSPVVFLLSLYGMYRRRSFLLASLASFLVIPVFIVRIDARYVLPYIPVLILYSLIGLECIWKRAYRPAYALLCLSVAVCIFFNRQQLTSPVSPGMQWAKRAAPSFRGLIKPGAKIADREPYFAFYVEGKYVEIPVAPYDEAIEYLASHDVDYLVLHRELMSKLRPELTPLLSDRAVINGEMRFVQFSFNPDGVCIYRRVMDAEPLHKRYLVPPLDGKIWGLSWSPDGRKIAFRRTDASGKGGIYIISPDEGEPRLVVDDPNDADQISWAPDSKRIAFTMKRAGSMNIYIVNQSGDVVQITSRSGTNASPFWTRDGKEIVFYSDASGQFEVWSVNLGTRAEKRLTTDGDNLCPTVSPDGRDIAWVRQKEGLCIRERGTDHIIRAEAPRNLLFTPSWSPDGRFLAVSASDWKKLDLYLLTADGRNAALLTKYAFSLTGIPAWSPDGDSLAAVSLEGSKAGIIVLTGLQPYEDRLGNSLEIHVFEP